MRYHPHKAPANSCVSDALSLLGAQTYEQLVTFNFQLGVLLRAKVGQLRGKDSGVRRVLTPLFKTMVPLHRDLTKLLHQRGAGQAFLPVVDRLAQVLASEIVYRQDWSTRSLESIEDVGKLPVSGELLAHLVFERPAHAPTWLAGLLRRQSWAEQAFRELKGSTIAELGEDYKARARVGYTAQNQRIAALLSKVQDALGAEDFGYLKDNLDIGTLKRFTR